MPKAIDLTGQRFCRWTVIRRAATVNQQTRWECLCDCGNVGVVKTNNLRTAISRSCGCLKLELSAARKTRHGSTNSPTWYTWAGMIGRCTNSTNYGYPWYGGRGIKVCDRWQGKDGFVNFLADMGERPVGMSIDRINVNGDYEPGNCRWADSKQQSRNRENTIRLTARGETLPVAEWAERVGCSSLRITQRLSRGWGVEDAIFKPKIDRKHPVSLGA